MEFFDKRIDDTVLETLRHIIESPFERHPLRPRRIEILERAGAASSSR